MVINVISVGKAIFFLVLVNYAACLEFMDEKQKLKCCTVALHKAQIGMHVPTRFITVFLILHK